MLHTITFISGVCSHVRTSSFSSNMMFVVIAKIFGFCLVLLSLAFLFFSPLRTWFTRLDLISGGSIPLTVCICLIPAK